MIRQFIIFSHSILKGGGISFLFFCLFARAFFISAQPEAKIKNPDPGRFSKSFDEFNQMDENFPISKNNITLFTGCLLYTSDAADE